MKILITTSSYGEFDSKPLDVLKAKGCQILLNPFGKKLNKEQTLELYSGDIEGVVAGTETIDKEVLEKATSLKVLSRCGTGIENIDTACAADKGIKIYNTPDGPTDAVAELTVGLVLALLRHIVFSDRNIRDGVWDKKMGALLKGKKVGIIGFGRIGRRTGQLLFGLGAKVVYCDPQVEENSVPDFIKKLMDDLLAESDVVILHLPYSEKNKGLIGKDQLSIMKAGAVLVNVSRGGIVEEDALYESIKKGHLAGAALDVFVEEPYNGKLKELDNVILTPHIGSYAKEARIYMETEAAKNLIKGLFGEDEDEA